MVRATPCDYIPALTEATGVLTLLVATSTYILMYACFRLLCPYYVRRLMHVVLRSSQGVARFALKLLLLGTILLYASSVVYWAATLGYVVSANRALSNAAGGLFSSSYSGDGGHIPGVETWYCIMSAAFTINVRDLTSRPCTACANDVPFLADLHRRQHSLVARPRLIPRQQNYSPHLLFPFL